MDQNIPTHPLLSTRTPTLPPYPESDEASLSSTLEMLRHLATLGMDFCNDLHASRATQAAPNTTTPRQQAADTRATAQTFNSIARTVRHTLALEASLRVARRTRAEAAAKAQLEARKIELRHRMQPVLQAAPNKTFADTRSKISDSIANWDAEQDLTHRSVDHAIARICRDFAVAPPPAPQHSQCRSP